MTVISNNAGQDRSARAAALDDDAIASEIRVVQSVQIQRAMPVLLFGNALAVTIVAYLNWSATVSSHAVYFLGGELLLLLPMLHSYLRLRRPHYSDAQLGEWLERIRAQTWESAYVFFKHEDAGAGPRTAKRFLEFAGAPF